MIKKTFDVYKTKNPDIFLIFLGITSITKVLYKCYNFLKSIFSITKTEEFILIEKLNNHY